MGAPSTSNDMSTTTTDKEIEELHAQLGMDLTKIQGHVTAGTLPREWEVEQEQDGSEVKRLTALISNMRPQHCILQAMIIKNNRGS